MGHWARRLSHDSWTFSSVMSGAWWSYSLYFCTTWSAMRALLRGGSGSDDGDGPLRAGFRRPHGRGQQLGVIGLVRATDDGRVAQVVLRLEELLLERPAAPVALAPPVVDEHLHPAPPPNHRDEHELASWILVAC